MSKNYDDFSVRMKEYEFHETQRKVLTGLPIYCRIDGRGFSKFTKGMNRPFDERMSNAMGETTKYLVKETNAKIGFYQSDEISLVYQAPDYKSEVMFDGKIMKMTGVFASMATAAFTKAILNSDDLEFRKYADRMPHFDCRIIPMPSQIEAANMVLWRTQDAFKNAISMAAHHHFSHKSLQGLNGSEMQERMFQEKGINFATYYPTRFKQGVFIKKKNIERVLTEKELSKIPENKRPSADTTFIRTVVEEVDVPVFSKVINRVGFIFNDEEPITA